MPRIKKIELSNGLYAEYGHLILSTCLVQTLRSLLWNTVYLVTIRYSDCGRPRASCVPLSIERGNVNFFCAFELTIFFNKTRRYNFISF